MEREEGRPPRSDPVEMPAGKGPDVGGGAMEHGHDAVVILHDWFWRNEWTSR